ncbi:hypothetical protein HNR40_008113 [Nonomuraea endophytica]|uniref:DDE Tnp4 domain-containing protein n=1 Tax=Nonomuraea endophytica TaxID=714136 RepID=A0A7W8EL88_9ACTN|nr:hypothetical protein [Nonomuraea endophytica]
MHDLTAARDTRLIDAPATGEMMTGADKGYQGGGPIRTPFTHHRHRPSCAPKDANWAHARIPGVGERAVATLKTWKILVKLRYCPRRATAIVQAILILHAIETNRYPG